MKVYDINGVEVVMYTIGDLAQELGRESQTIRKWEMNGVIPPTRFRDRTNKRLYPEKLVKMIKQISEEEGVTQGVSFEATNFSARVAKAFKEVEAELLG